MYKFDDDFCRRFFLSLSASAELMGFSPAKIEGGEIEDEDLQRLLMSAHHGAIVEAFDCQPERPLSRTNNHCECGHAGASPVFMGDAS